MHGYYSVTNNGFHIINYLMDQNYFLNEFRKTHSYRTMRESKFERQLMNYVKSTSEIDTHFIKEYFLFLRRNKPIVYVYPNIIHIIFAKIRPTCEQISEYLIIIKSHIRDKTGFDIIKTLTDLINRNIEMPYDAFSHVCKLTTKIVSKPLTVEFLKILFILLEKNEPNINDVANICNIQSNIRLKYKLLDRILRQYRLDINEHLVLITFVDFQALNILIYNGAVITENIMLRACFYIHNVFNGLTSRHMKMTIGQALNKYNNNMIIIKRLLLVNPPINSSMFRALFTNKNLNKLLKYKTLNIRKLLADAAELLIVEGGYTPTYSDLTYITNRRCYIYNIERFGIELDTNFISICQAANYYPPYEDLHKLCVPVAPKTGLEGFKQSIALGAKIDSQTLIAACSVPNNLSVVKYIINECGIVAEMAHLRVACNTPRNKRVFKFLIEECHLQPDVDCLKQLCGLSRDSNVKYLASKIT